MNLIAGVKMGLCLHQGVWYRAPWLDEIRLSV